MLYLLSLSALDCMRLHANAAAEMKLLYLMINPDSNAINSQELNAKGCSVTK